MTERKGKILSYNPTNRLGEIQPEGTSLRARFYLPVVTNPEPLPKAGDVVNFEAPEPRKNKQGKSVQGDATSVTVVEYAPAPPPRAAAPHRHPRDSRGKSRDGRGRFPRREGRSRSDSAPPRQGERSRTEHVAGGEKKPRGIRRPRQEGRDRKPRQPRTENRRQVRGGAFARARLLVPTTAAGAILESNACHPGLLFDRLIAFPLQGGPLAEAQKRFFIEHAVLPTQHALVESVLPFSAVRRRQEELLTLLEESGESVWSTRLRLHSRLVLSLTARSLLGAFGGSWRYSDAIPVLPGSLLKGVVKAFLRGEQAAQTFPDLAAEIDELRSVFNTASECKVTLFDALAISRSAMLQTDGVFCTQPALYAQGFDPTPGQRGRSSLFFAIKPGAEFIFSLSVAGPKDQSKRVADSCGRLLQQLALHIGFGALTEAGYGRFYVPTPRPAQAKDNPNEIATNEGGAS